MQFQRDPVVSHCFPGANPLKQTGIVFFFFSICQWINDKIRCAVNLYHTSFLPRDFFQKKITCQYNWAARSLRCGCACLRNCSELGRDVFPSLNSESYLLCACLWRHTTKQCSKVLFSLEKSHAKYPQGKAFGESLDLLWLQQHSTPSFRPHRWIKWHQQKETHERRLLTEILAEIMVSNIWRPDLMPAELNGRNVIGNEPLVFEL